MSKLIVDCETGDETAAPLTPEDEAQRDADRAAAADRQVEANEQEAVRRRLTELAKKVKAGTATTAERTEAMNLAVRAAAGVM